MNPKFLILILSFFFSLICHGKDYFEEENFYPRFTNLEITKEFLNNKVGAIGKMFNDNNGNLFFYDWSNNQILQYSLHNNSLKTIYKDGQIDKIKVSQNDEKQVYYVTFNGIENYNKTLRLSIALSSDNKFLHILDKEKAEIIIYSIDYSLILKTVSLPSQLKKKEINLSDFVIKKGANNSVYLLTYNHNNRKRVTDYSIFEFDLQNLKTREINVKNKAFQDLGEISSSLNYNDGIEDDNNLYILVYSQGGGDISSSHYYLQVNPLTGECDGNWFDTKLKYWRELHLPHGITFASHFDYSYKQSVYFFESLNIVFTEEKKEILDKAFQLIKENKNAEVIEFLKSLDNTINSFLYLDAYKVFATQILRETVSKKFTIHVINKINNEHKNWFKAFRLYRNFLNEMKILNNINDSVNIRISIQDTLYNEDFYRDFIPEVFLAQMDKSVKFFKEQIKHVPLNNEGNNFHCHYVLKNDYRQSLTELDNTEEKLEQLLSIM